MHNLLCGKSIFCDQIFLIEFSFEKEFLFTLIVSYNIITIILLHQGTCRASFPTTSTSPFGTGKRPKENTDYDAGCNCYDCKPQITCGLQCYKSMMGQLGQLVNQVKELFEFPKNPCLHCTQAFLLSLVRYAVGQEGQEPKQFDPFVKSWIISLSTQQVHVEKRAMKSNHRADEKVPKKRSRK
jgi:hypothetical protein